MLDAIKSVLGDDFASLETVLTELPDVKAKLEAVEFVPKSKLDEANSKAKVANEQLTSVRASLDSAEGEMATLKDSIKDNETLKTQIQEAQQRINEMSATHQKEVENQEKKYLAMNYLKDNGCLISDLIIDKLDFDQVMVANGAIVSGLDNQVEPMKTAYPTGFKKTDVQTGVPDNKDTDPKPKLSQLKDQLEKSTNLVDKIALNRQIAELENQKT